MMTRIPLLLVVMACMVACKPTPLLSRSADANARAADALERIANVLENPGCICPQDNPVEQQTLDASEVFYATE